MPDINGYPVEFSLKRALAREGKAEHIATGTHVQVVRAVEAISPEATEYGTHYRVTFYGLRGSLPDIHATTYRKLIRALSAHGIKPSDPWLSTWLSVAIPAE